MKKKLNKELSAGTEADSSTKAEGMQVSPANAKPNVRCRRGKNKDGDNIIVITDEMIENAKPKEGSTGWKRIGEWLTYITFVELKKQSL